MVGKNDYTGRGIHDYALVSFFVLTGLGISMLVYWIIPRGPGVEADSVKFIETARNLVDGQGFYINERPMTHHPPGYPLLQHS